MWFFRVWLAWLGCVLIAGCFAANADLANQDVPKSQSIKLTPGAIRVGAWNLLNAGVHSYWKSDRYARAAWTINRNYDLLVALEVISESASEALLHALNRNVIQQVHPFQPTWDVLISNAPGYRSDKLPEYYAIYFRRSKVIPCDDRVEHLEFYDHSQEGSNAIFYRKPAFGCFVPAIASGDKDVPALNIAAYHSRYGEATFEGRQNKYRAFLELAAVFKSMQETSDAAEPNSMQEWMIAGDFNLQSSQISCLMELWNTQELLPPSLSMDKRTNCEAISDTLRPLWPVSPAPWNDIPLQTVSDHTFDTPTTVSPEGGLANDYDHFLIYDKEKTGFIEKAKPNIGAAQALVHHMLKSTTCMPWATNSACYTNLKEFETIEKPRAHDELKVFRSCVSDHLPVGGVWDPQLLH